MSDWLMRVIKAEAERLIELAAEDDELRADLRALAQSILAATASAVQRGRQRCPRPIHRPMVPRQMHSRRPNHSGS